MTQVDCTRRLIGPSWGTWWLLRAILTLAVAGCSLSTPSPTLPAPIDGPVVAIQGDGTAGSHIQVRSADGTVVDFLVGKLMHEMPAHHLADHMARGAPVRVYFRYDNRQAVAYDIVDAVSQ